MYCICLFKCAFAICLNMTSLSVPPRSIVTVPATLPEYVEESQQITSKEGFGDSMCILINIGIDYMKAVSF